MRDISREYQGKTTLSARGGAGLVAIFAIAIRVWMVFVYQPVSFGDSPSYWRTAQAVIDGFSGYDGTRTPGYPIFMAILRTDERVWVAQMILGVLISLLLYFIALKNAGFVVRLFHHILVICHSFGNASKYL